MSKGRAVILATAIVLCAAMGPAVGLALAERQVIEVFSAGELQAALSSPLQDVTIRLAPGDYHLTPSDGIDESCGNCDDPAREIPITIGVRVSGRAVWIEGPDRGEAVIYTHAGYGVFFEDCADCRIKNVTVTGGVRDESPDATDAAIVARRSKLYVQNCVIRDNIGDADLLARNVVGIIGVCGREGANLFVYESRIIRNSWDGIALYRDAEARIFHNVIDGVDRAAAKEAGGGRGVAVGVTWNATARIERNLIRRYWKGVGIFVDARAQVVNNVIEEMLTWGIVCWDAGTGRPSAAIGGNAIFDCGACGMSITRATPLGSGEYASFTGNAVVRTGQNPKYDDAESYCPQCAVAIIAAPDGFRFQNNLFYDNRRATTDLPDYDIAEDVFRNRVSRTIRTIVGPADGYAARVVFRESSFIREYTRD